MSVKKVLDIARGELGTKESPAGSNRTPYGKWYGLDGQPWCMMFVQWCFAQAGQQLPYITASCSALLNWCRRHHKEYIVSAPQPGDVVIYSFGHTGIVENAGNGKITVIEGNTSPTDAGSQDNGGMVCRRTRNQTAAAAYLRFTEEKEDKRMDNVPSPAHKEGVDWAVKNGILTGDASGDLKLAQNVTRQQLCTMLYRFARSIGKA